MNIEHRTLNVQHRIMNSACRELSFESLRINDGVERPVVSLFVERLVVSFCVERPVVRFPSRASLRGPQDLTTGSNDRVGRTVNFKKKLSKPTPPKWL